MTGVLPDGRIGVIIPTTKKVLRVTACCERRMEFLSASINPISQKIDLKKGPTRNTSRKTRERESVTGTMLSSSTIYLKRNGKRR